MANVLYPKAKEHFLAGDIDMVTGVIRCVLVDTGVYTYSAAHEDYADLSGIVGTESDALANKAITNGVFDSDDPTFSAVTGNEAEAIVMFLDTGVAANDLLIAYIDTATNLPVTPNGGDIQVSVNASGWFEL